MKRMWSLLLAAALVLTASGCTAPAEEAADGIVLPIYFIAPSGTASGGDALMCSEELLPLREDASAEEMARVVVQQLLQGSGDGKLNGPFPKGASLLSLSVRGTRAQVDLTGISRMDSISLTLAGYCLALSLAAIDGIESVSFTCDGRLLAQQPRRVYYPHDVLLSTGDSMVQQIEVLLYFVDEDGMLVPEKRTLDLYEGETQSAVLMAALLAGPKDPRLVSVIPKGFSVISIKVEDGVCFIHFPSSAILLLPEDEVEQHLILWSLAESLYSLSYIDEIRMLADGEELEYFGMIPVDSVAERPQG